MNFVLFHIHQLFFFSGLWSRTTHRVMNFQQYYTNETKTLHRLLNRNQFMDRVYVYVFDDAVYMFQPYSIQLSFIIEREKKKLTVKQHFVFIYFFYFRKHFLLSLFSVVSLNSSFCLSFKLR